MRKLPHRFELRLAVMAMLALFVAQLGAMSHAYSHDASASHLAGTTSHNPCGDCLAYAPLLSAVGAGGSLPFIEPQGRSAAARAIPDSLVDLSLPLAFRSRAPPSTR